MALGNPIQLRLSLEKQLMYEAEASGRNMPLATYLRERLEAGDDVLDELSALRRAVERVTAAITAATLNDGGQASRDMSVQLEMLLLLRTLTNPQKVQIVHSELRRLGFDIWDGNKEINNESR